MTPRFHFTRRDADGPAAHAPVRATPSEPVTYTVSWLRFFMVLALAVAWLVPLTFLTSRLLWPPAKTGPREAYSFMALVYSGVSDKTNEVSPALFREHLKALKQSGYVPITLQDVRDLVQDGKPVPRKAVLLTMDHSRKTSYYLTKSHLRSAGWNAVMFLWTRAIEEDDPASLLWPYVRALVRSPNWEIGAQSEGGFHNVPADPYGATGHALTTRRWLAGEGRYETYEELAERVEQDHQRCLATIEQHVERRPIAYAYPYGDFGQYQRKQQDIKRINLGLAGRYYDLAFLTDNFPLNTRHSDPRRLNRLRVRPEWSAQALVQLLDRSWPRDDRCEFTNVVEAAAAWTVDWGSMKVEETRLVLQSDGQQARGSADAEGHTTEDGREWLILHATEKITGARMWLSGSDERQDLYGRIPFRLLNGQMGVFLRGAPDEEQYVYLGIDAAGSVWLRQKHAGLETFTLASTRTRLGGGQTDNVLEIYMRGVQFGALLNGVPLFSEGLTLRGAPEPGMIGISVWDTQAGRARLELGNIVVSPQEPTLVAWQEDPDAASFQTRWIHRNGFRITHLSPAWLSVSAAGSTTRLEQDPDLSSMLVRMYRLKRMPRVDIRSDRWSSLLTPSQLARSVQDQQADGAFLDFSFLDVVPINALTAWLQQTLDLFAAKGLQLAVRMPRLLEDPAVLQPVIATLPGLQLAVTADSPVRAGVPGARLAPIVAETMPGPATAADIPPVHQIEEAGATREMSVPERIRYLQDEGKAALLANNFQEAIALWLKWHELDPGDASPLMLLGDVHVRMGDVAKALDYYDQSLALDPSRITLAMRRIGLLESEGREEEALRQLNLYARLFPESSDVLIAQIAWLMRHQREQEARGLILRTLEMKPDDLDVLVNAIRLAPTRQERRSYIGRLRTLCEDPEQHLEFGEAIQKYDLLALPDAYLLMPLVERIADTSANPQVAALFQQFRVLDHPVAETFGLGRMSDAWILDGGEALGDSRAMLRVQAGNSRREVSCRLRGSEMMQNGYIEADLAGYTGEFWLMACRGPNHYIRFGFDSSSRLFLQVWKDGRRLANQSRFLPGSARGVRLRLAVRGGGAVGYVDGKPAFDAPATLPPDLGHGTWGFSLYDAEPGRGMARIGALAAGPLPLVVGALPPAGEPADSERTLDALKALVLDLSVVAPRWFQWQPNGNLARLFDPGDDMYALMARFYGLKLMPLIDMAGRDSIEFAKLTKLARDNRLNGFVLLLPGTPPAKWIKSIEAALEREPLDLLLIAPGKEEGGPDVVYGFGPLASAFVGQGAAPQIHTRYAGAGGAAAYERNTLLMIRQEPPAAPTVPVAQIEEPAAETPPAPAQDEEAASGEAEAPTTDAPVAP